jgi:hypothetical protein
VSECFGLELIAGTWIGARQVAGDRVKARNLSMALRLPFGGPVQRLIVLSAVYPTVFNNIKK